MMTPDLCPCDKRKPFAECCGPYLAGTAFPATAADLMRSRYTAFVKHDVDYILKTIAPARRKEFDRKGIEDWSRNADWQGLEIVATKNGGPGDDAGEVEFVAKYKEAGKDQRHEELATFLKIDGRWHFDDGRPPPVKQVIHEGPRIGRNDPCHCGSGKKYKKCHGAAAG